MTGLISLQTIKQAIVVLHHAPNQRPNLRGYITTNMYGTSFGTIWSLGSECDATRIIVFILNKNKLRGVTKICNSKQNYSS